MPRVVARASSFTLPLFRARPLTVLGDSHNVVPNVLAVDTDLVVHLVADEHATRVRAAHARTDGWATRRRGRSTADALAEPGEVIEALITEVEIGDAVR